MTSYGGRVVRSVRGQYVFHRPLYALFATIVAALAAPPLLADAVVSPPVKPRAVTIKPSDMPPMTSGPVVVPEGEPLPTEPPIRKKPDYDPSTQLSPSSSLANALDLTSGINLISAPLRNFAGINTLAEPPDPVGDVGPHHYVQMVNSTQFQVWDKQGSSLLGPANFGGLWPATDPCSNNFGDPIVVYDHLADRWLLSQFTSTDDETRSWSCIAMSQSPDPSTNSWYLYTFEMDAMPDYPKFGVWPDGYYMSTHEGSQLGIFVFDRASMLTGNAAAFIKETLADPTPSSGVRDTRILPADLDGPAPPDGTPNFFVRTVDDQQDIDDANDRVEIYEAIVDWNTMSFSFTLANDLRAVDGLVPFDVMVCNRTGWGARDCIPQPDTKFTIDAVSSRPMMQLKFRNFYGDYRMVLNQTIDVSGSIPNSLGIAPVFEVAGIRWYELQNTGGGWEFRQQGTFAAQPIDADDESELLHRWMGSAAIDKDGNIAIGYSIVNDDDDDGEEVYPGISYTGRRFDDVLNLLPQGEQSIRAGTVPNRSLYRRWGDYSALSVDPVNECTFWYTNHLSKQERGSRTQIGSFRFDTCSTDLAIRKTASPDPAAGASLSYVVTVDNNGPTNATNVQVVDTLPPEVTYQADTGSCVEAPVGTLTCDLGNLDSGESTSFTILVLVEADLVDNVDGPTALTNTARVSSDLGETYEINNTITVVTQVENSGCLPDGIAGPPTKGAGRI